MANAGRWKAGANPFLEDDSEDVDDFTFLSRSKPSGPGFSSSRQQNSINQEWEQRRDQLLAERRQLGDRILDKSDSAVRVMYDTEQVGIATAEELAHQGEQLKNVDRRLDNINTNMKTSQKHLNSMKTLLQLCSVPGSMLDPKPPCKKVQERSLQHNLFLYISQHSEATH
uniref:Putative ubisnap n=1 Tax=Ixodes ricinus TaxID=34613 RepID=V5HDC5_IXORI